MSVGPNLRVIDGGREPRVAVPTGALVAPVTPGSRLSDPMHGARQKTFPFGVVISLAVHAAALTCAIQWQFSGEARSAGGNAQAIIIEGISFVAPDSVPNAGAVEAPALPPEATEIAEAETAYVDSSAERAAAVESTFPPDASSPITERASAMPAMDERAVTAEADNAAPVAVAAVEDTEPAEISALPDAATAASRVDSQQSAGIADVDAAVAAIDAALAASPVSDPPAEAADTVPEIAPTLPAATVVETLQVAQAGEVARRSADTPPPEPAVESISPLAPEIPATAPPATLAQTDATDEVRPVTADIAAADAPTAPPEAQPMAAEAAKALRDETTSRDVVDDATAAEADAESAKLEDVIPEETMRAKPPRNPAKTAPKQPASPRKPKPARSAPPSVASSAQAQGGNTGTAGAGGTEADAAGLATQSTYEARLVAHLRRFKTYPPEARRRGIAGTVVVNFTIDAVGRVTGVQMASPTGEALLDGAALAMVRRASPFPAIPAALRRSQFSVRAPIHFDLR